MSFWSDLTGRYRRAPGTRLTRLYNQPALTSIRPSRVRTTTSQVISAGPAPVPGIPTATAVSVAVGSIGAVVGIGAVVSVGAAVAAAVGLPAAGVSVVTGAMVAVAGTPVAVAGAVVAVRGALVAGQSQGRFENDFLRLLRFIHVTGSLWSFLQ